MPEFAESQTFISRPSPSARALELSIVLPTYKEKENLQVLIPQIEDEFQGVSFEIIVVDDNSKDGIKELLEELNKKFGNIHLIERGGLYGIGSALRDGYNEARGEYILSSDADLSFKTADMKLLYAKIKEGYDLALGYKKSYIGRKQDSNPNNSKKGIIKLSYLVSFLGNLTIKILSGIRLKNFNTNFRILRNNKWRGLRTQENYNFFNLETILKAHRAGFRVCEIPVIYYERKYGKSKLNFFRDAPSYFKKLIWYVFFDKSS